MNIILKQALKLVFTTTIFLSATQAMAAVDKNKKKKAAETAAWQKEFSKHLAYSKNNKELLHDSFVLLEVFIDANGMVTIEKYNANKPNAAEYVVSKLNGITIDAALNERFIIKYYFK
jgi:hypothetical protein